MILTASILWAVLATGLCIAWCALAKSERSWKDYWYKEATDCLNKWDAAEAAANTWRRLAIDLQDKIDRDASKRSSITSRGNITRAAKRRALVQAKAAELRGAEPDRIAA